MPRGPSRIFQSHGLHALSVACRASVNRFDAVAVFGWK